jgi:uncharacterized protein (DUF433 family)
MSYKPELAATLSGASVRQLAYWRSRRFSEPLLAPEACTSRARVAYSFQDVVALRSFMYLRSKAVSLQRVRKAVRELRERGEMEHLSAYQLVAVGGGDVVWRKSDGEAIDLTGRPGQRLIAEMVDILAAFTVGDDARVVALFEPARGVSVDPEVRGGYPVIAGTRVPFDLVASLVADGVDPVDIAAFYPSVNAEGAEGARSLADLVGAVRGTHQAA